VLAGVVDVCLIPEVQFVLRGEKGLFAYLEKVLENRGHAVVCLAEGAGQVRPA
jgi:6-phosphofructokinase 1